MIDTDNNYIIHLDRHPWNMGYYCALESQYNVEDRVSRHLAYIFLFKYKETYIGVVESTKPNTATYLYSFPDEYIELYASEYVRDLEDPLITREPSFNKREEAREISYLISQIKGQLGTSYGKYREDGEDSIDERIRHLTASYFRPIKSRFYFIDEIPHTKLEKWAENIERKIANYAETGEKHQLSSLETDNSFGLTMQSSYNVYYNQTLKDIIAEIKKVCRANNKLPKEKKKKKTKTILTGKVIKQEKLFEPHSLDNKSINEIAMLLEIAPQTLFTILHYKYRFNITKMSDKLDSNRISKCQDLLEELWKKQQKK